MNIRRHIKTKRQPRKKVRNAATDKRCCIVNCIEKVKLLEIEEFGHKIKVNPEIRWNGNGAKWKPSKWYAEQREKRKKYLDENYSKKPQNYSHIKPKRKQPWYMLQKGKFYQYKEQKMDWGTKTDYIKVDSEYAEMQKKYAPQKLGEAERLHMIEQLKIAKWERKNQCPVEINGKQKDLFENQFLPQWREEREKALERIRDFVVSAYGKNTKDKIKGRKKQKPPITILDFRECKQQKYKNAA